MKLKNVIVDSVRTMKDWSCKITLVTRELKPDEMANIFLSLNKEMMWIDIPDEVWDTKSPSQRLRAVLYRVWESKKGEFKTFSLYYNYVMEQLIDRYKEKI